MLSSKQKEMHLRNCVLLSRDGTEPLHAQLTRSLRNLIVRHYADGEPFYPEQELCMKLDVSMGTLRHALARLVEEGLLERHRGKGTIVKRKRLDSLLGFQVVMLVNTYDSFFNRVLMREIAHQCRIRNMPLDVINLEQDKSAMQVLDACLARRGIEYHRRVRSTAKDGRPVLGFIFLSLLPDFTYDLYRATESRGAPSVNIDTWIAGYPGSQIVADNRKGMEQGMNYLVSLGHKRITLLLSEQAWHPNIAERIGVFRESVKKHGLHGAIVETEPIPETWDELRLPLESSYDWRVNDDVAKSVLATNPTAVFAVSDIGACMLMKRLQMAGKKIPDDISVMGFNDEGICRMVYPELTSIAQPFEEMSEKTVQLLARPEREAQHHILAPRLIARNSTASPT